MEAEVSFPRGVEVGATGTAEPLIAQGQAPLPTGSTEQRQLGSRTLCPRPLTDACYLREMRARRCHPPYRRGPWGPGRCETHEKDRQRREGSQSGLPDAGRHPLNRLLLVLPSGPPRSRRSLGTRLAGSPRGRAQRARLRGAPSPPPRNPRRPPRPLTRSSSARSRAGRMRWPRQRPPGWAQAAHTGRRSEPQNHRRAWPCSGHSGSGSGPDPRPALGPTAWPSLSADMAERPPGAARSTCRRWLGGGASAAPPPGPAWRPPARAVTPLPSLRLTHGWAPWVGASGPWPRSRPLQQFFLFLFLLK